MNSSTRSVTPYQFGDLISSPNGEVAKSTDYNSGVTGILDSRHSVTATIPKDSKYEKLTDAISLVLGGRPKHRYEQVPEREESAPAAMRQKSFLKETEDFFFDKSPPFSKTYPSKEEPLISLPKFSLLGSKSQKPTSLLARDLKRISFIGKKSENKSPDRVANTPDGTGESTPLLKR
ncbi:MAG: hypothetical protein ACH346_07565 [Chthoniobacterales bacterium]